MTPPRYHSQVQDPMGIPFNLYFGALAIAHCGTLAFLGFSVVQQQSLERHIVQLTLELQGHRREVSRQVLSGESYPDPNPSPGTAAPFGENRKPGAPSVGWQDQDRSSNRSDKDFPSWLALVVFLGLLLLAGFSWVRVNKSSVADVSGGPPVNQRLLAQRQLAERRLRRNGFGQSIHSSGI